MISADVSKFFSNLPAGLTARLPQTQYAAQCALIFDGGYPGSTGKGMLEGDTGVGKTIAYGICLILRSVQDGKPGIVTTYTRQHRRQVVAELRDLAKMLAPLCDGGEVPVHEWISKRSFCSAKRIAARLKDRLLTTEQRETLRNLLTFTLNSDAAAEGRAVTDQLTGSGEFEEFLDLTEAHADAWLIGERDLLCLQSGEHSPAADLRSQLPPPPAVYVMTHTMAVGSPKFDKMVENDEICAAVMDEADRLPAAARLFLEKTLSLAEFANAIAAFKAAKCPVGKLKKHLTALESAFDGVKVYAANAGQKLIVLSIDALQNAANDDQTLINNAANARDAVYDALDKLHLELKAVGRKIPAEDLSARSFYTRLLDALYTLKRTHKPSPAGQTVFRYDIAGICPVIEWTKTDVRMTIGMTRPAALLWRLWASSIPVVLTSARLVSSTAPTPGDRYKSFALKIGLAKAAIDPKSCAIVAQQHGHLELVYLPDRQTKRLPHPTRKTVVDNENVWVTNTDIFDVWEEVARYVDAQARKKEQDRTLVLCNSYPDIQAIYERIGDLDNVFCQSKKTPLEVAIRKFRDHPQGMLLTVAWEGLNLPGLVDNIILTRLPFAPASPLNAAALHHAISCSLDTAEGILLHNDSEECCLRITQGIGRGLRGPNERCRVYVCDRRMPFPPSVANSPVVKALLNGGKPWDKWLSTAIQNRFRNTVPVHLYENGAVSPVQNISSMAPGHGIMRTIMKRAV